MRQTIEIQVWTSVKSEGWSNRFGSHQTNTAFKAIKLDEIMLGKECRWRLLRGGK